MLSDTMPTAPIERLFIKNYGCIKDVEIRLTRLHAFIGPNDSGKSTILRAVRTFMQYASKNPTVDEKWVGDIDPSSLNIAIQRNNLFVGIRRSTNSDNPVFPVSDTLARRTLGDELYDAQMVRLDADSMSQPTSLIPDSQILRLIDEKGLGLPGIYDAIANRDVEAYLKIQADLRALFPTVKKLQLQNVSNSTKALAIELNDGTRVPAEQMSEGMLYYLAFAALRHIEPTSVLLVEEPENGLHPARIADVMRILREISRESQVLIATHSPLVINELEPEEVSVVTRRPGEGTKVTPIRQTPNFEERAKIYALGELWLSYADGTYEEPLLQGPRRAS